MTNTTRKNIFQLFWPIFAETLLMILVGSVDTLMVSKVSDNAAGAIGSSNSFIALFVISFSIISGGVMSVMTQYIGAKKESVAVKALKLGLIINTILGLTLSFILFFFAKDFLNLMDVQPVQFKDALTYTRVIGVTLFLNAITPILSSYLRAFGKTSLPMISSLSANLVNVIFNAIWIFGLFGAPELGVYGVALATVIAKVVNLVLNIIFSLVLVKPTRDNFEITYFKVFKQIIKIGLPAALETTLYNISMALIARMINGMDGEGLNNTARSYAQTITHFSYVIGLSIGQANAIMVGWAIGENKCDEAYKFTLRRLKYGILLCTLVATTLALCSTFVVGLFTNNKEILRLCRMILYLDIILELGRVTNLTIGIALKTSGDAVYTVVIGIIFMFLLGVGGSYLFGVSLDMLVVGCYIGLAADEVVRGIFMLFRWKTKKWTTKSFIKHKRQEA